MKRQFKAKQKPVLNQKLPNFRVGGRKKGRKATASLFQSEFASMEIICKHLRNVSGLFSVLENSAKSQSC